MMSAEFHIRYVGDSWSDVVEENKKKADPTAVPGLTPSVCHFISFVH